MVAFKLVAVYVGVVLAIAVPAVAKLFKDDSHLTIVPVCPDKVKTVLLVPVHTVVEPFIVPPTGNGLTLIIATAELAVAQTPL